MLTEKQVKMLFDSGSDVQEHVEQIHKLAKIRAALAFGSRTSIRDKAEGTLSRAITTKVNNLSQLVEDLLKSDK